MAQVPFLNLEDLKTIEFSERALVETSQDDYCVTVAELIEKLDEENEEIKSILALLGETTVICRLFLMNQQVYCAIPKIYRDESDKIALYDAQDNPQPIAQEIKFVEYTTEFILQTNNNLFIGHQTLAISTPEMTAAFKVPFGIHSDFQSGINQKYEPENPEKIQSLMPKGKGAVPAQIINYYPRSVTPLSTLSIGETFQVKEDLGLDPRLPGATRFRLQKLEGDNPIKEPFEVWANYSLRQHYQQYGNLPCTVISKEEKDNRTRIKFSRADLAKIS